MKTRLRACLPNSCLLWPWQRKLCVLNTETCIGATSSSSSLHETPWTHQLQAQVIDFMLSRLEKDGHVEFSNVADDEDLFNGQGDYQFEIYRKMRADNLNNWHEFRPKSKALWCHYLIDKMVSDRHLEGTAGHLTELDNLANMLDNYRSAEDPLMRSPYL